MPAFLTGLGASIITGLTGATSMAVGAAPFATAVGAAATGAGVWGAVEGANAIGRSIKQAPPIQQAQAQAVPSATGMITTAEESAKTAMEQKRRMRALSGGKTLLTNETLGSSGTTAPKSLLGS